MTVDFKKYTEFVDEVTSEASKDADYFTESCEIIEEQGVQPERILTAAIGITAEGGEFAEIVKKCFSKVNPLMKMHNIMQNVSWVILCGILHKRVSH